CQGLLQRLIPLLPLQAVALQLLAQRADNLLLRQAAEAGQRQLPPRLQAGGSLRQLLLPGRPSVNQSLLEQPLAELIPFQPIQGEGLVVLYAVLLLTQEGLQPPGEELLHRIAQKPLQQAGIQGPVRQQLLQRHIRLLFTRLRPMQQAPFTGIAEQLTAPIEVAPTEGLQGVVGSQRGQQVAATVQLPAGRQMIAQLPDQHRGRTLGVVADAATDPADAQYIPCRQQCFQQQIAVILAPGAVTGAIVAGHQIEIQRRLRARVIAVIHAQQIDMAE